MHRFKPNKKFIVAFRLLELKEGLIKVKIKNNWVFLVTITTKILATLSRKDPRAWIIRLAEPILVKEDTIVESDIKIEPLDFIDMQKVYETCIRD